MGKTILSIQSHVAFGYVGNRAATFPLQRMGFEVVTVNTVQFSNHTGYGEWTGEVFSPAHIQNLLDGVYRHIPKVDAVLSGYLGDAEIGRIVLNALDQFDCDLWLCDPVMGDFGRDIFVREKIPEFFKNEAINRARIMTPNHFELQVLTGRTIRTPQDALDACKILHDLGVETVFVKSFAYEGLPADKISMMASDEQEGHYIVEVPKVPIRPPLNGAGDVTSALLLGHILDGTPINEALSLTASALYDIFEKTYQNGQTELALIEMQDCFLTPRKIYQARSLDRM